MCDSDVTSSDNSCVMCDNHDVLSLLEFKALAVYFMIISCLGLGCFVGIDFATSYMIIKNL